MPKANTMIKWAAACSDSFYVERQDTQEVFLPGSAARPVSRGATDPRIHPGSPCLTGPTWKRSRKVVGWAATAIRLVNRFSHGDRLQ